MLSFPFTFLLIAYITLTVLAASFRMFDSVLEVVSGDLRCLDVNSGKISIGVLGDEGTLEMSLTLSKSSS